MLVSRQFDAGDFLNALNDMGKTGEQARELADLWIATGILPGGVEEPKHRILPALVRESIHNLTDSPLSFSIMPDGTVQKQFSFAPHLPIHIGREALMNLDDRYGIYSFLLFLDCDDLRFRLARCQHDGCAAPYFWRERLRQIYKNGAVCPHHRPQAAGNRKRRDEQHDLLRLAVRFWPKWKPDRHPSRALWIARQINAQRAVTKKRITQKWVSRNEVAIQAWQRKTAISECL